MSVDGNAPFWMQIVWGVWGVVVIGLLIGNPWISYWLSKKNINQNYDRKEKLIQLGHQNDLTIQKNEHNHQYDMKMLEKLDDQFKELASENRAELLGKLLKRKNLHLKRPTGTKLK